ncbi:YcaO-like family protein [Streptomyces phaeochromogenes]|uniref:YcaO-like family protein n=1 Tax=Streptomyces phaeochromogenes TaxID=1923 RepID=UPI0033EB0F77
MDDPQGELSQHLETCLQWTGQEELTVSVVYDWDREQLADMMERSGWHIPVVLDTSRVHIGPCRIGGLDTATIQDYLDRLVAAASDRRKWVRETAQPAVTSAYDQNDLAWVARHVAEVAFRLSSGKADRTVLDRVRVLRFRDRSVHEHVVLRNPQRGSSGIRHQEGDLVDAQTGIVVSTASIPALVPLPVGMILTQSRASDMGRILPWANNLINGGCTWDDEAGAHAIAIAEGIERYCGNYIGRTAIRTTCYEDLIAQGESALDPNLLEFFSDEQHGEPGFPFLPFTRTTQTSWVQGFKLGSREPSWLPASLVYVNWNIGDSYAEPPLHPAFYPGIASGRSADQAIANALEEIVERDSMMAWWLSGAKLPRTSIPLAEEWRFAALPDTISTDIVMIDNQFDLPVAMACVRDSERKTTAMGFACRNTPERAIMKSFLEAFGLLHALEDMQDPDGSFWGLMRRYPDMQTVVPHRADRRYLESLGSNYRRIGELWPQLQAYLDPRTFKWDVPWTPDDPKQLGSESPRGARDYRRYLDLLRREGFEAYAVELTTPDVAVCGYSVYRVIVPGMIPNFPTAFPPLGSGRFRRVAESLGWPCTTSTVREEPMAYA